MVDQQLRIHAKQFIQKVFISPGNVPRRMNPVLFQLCGNPPSNAPEICQRLVVPESSLKGFLVQLSDKIRGMLGRYIQGNLGQVEVGANPAGGPDTIFPQNISHNGLPQLPGRHLVKGQVISYIHKTLINGIHMNIFL